MLRVVPGNIITLIITHQRAQSPSPKSSSEPKGCFGSAEVPKQRAFSPAPKKWGASSTILKRETQRKQTLSSILGPRRVGPGNNSQFCPITGTAVPGCGRPPADSVRWGEGRHHPEQRAGSVCRVAGAARCLCWAPHPAGGHGRQIPLLQHGPRSPLLDGEHRPADRDPGEAQVRAAAPPPAHFVPEAGGPGCQPVLEGSPGLWARRNLQGVPEAGSRQHLSGSAATGRTDHCRVENPEC